MVDVHHGSIWWTDLNPPLGSEPGYKRPMLILQSNAFNRSSIATCIGATITSNLKLARMPGNLLLHSRDSGLKKDSVVNLSQITTFDKHQLIEWIGDLSQKSLRDIKENIKYILSIDF